jgi:hypothetical protein
LLRSAGLPVFLLPESGTVSAAALDLALGLSDGKVYVCGMDFKTRDIQTHTRPYLFDIMAGAKSTRTSPWYTRRFERALGMREGGSLDVYARWFERYEREHKERVFQFSEFKPEQNTEKLTWQDVNAVRALNERGLGRVVIEEIRREPEGAVCREVSELLFEGGEPHGIEKIEDKIASLLA